MKSREVRLRTPPTGAPRESDFEVADTELPALPAGHVLVRTLFASVDPYQRNRMRSGLRAGDAIPARCIGEVVESRSDAFRPGDAVFIAGGAWRDHLVCDAASVARLDPDLSPPQIHLGAAGIPGLTAYVGLLLHGAREAGETVFVSAAAGAVGSLACQIAKAQGCRVVGSAGSDEKVAWLIREARVDAAFNHKGADLAAEMRRCCPEGIDLLLRASAARSSTPRSPRCARMAGSCSAG
jgi:NADPH-dependent curcumin reductase CurA